MQDAVGYAARESARKLKTDDVLWIMSITKAYTAVAVLMAVDQGRFALSTPVCEIIPEFGTKGKKSITPWHLLTHTSGLDTEIPYGLPVEQLVDIEAVTAFLSMTRLHFTPGEYVHYNCIAGFSLLGALVQRTDPQKRPFRKILEEDLFLPLGMKDTALGLPDRLRDRIAPITVRDLTPGLFDPMLLEAINVLATEAMELPAGGAVSTVHDVFLFSEMLRQGGELNGRRVLSPALVKQATTIQTGDKVNHLTDYMRAEHGWPEIPANIGLAVFIRGAGTSPIHWAGLPMTASPNTFGAMGAGSTIFIVDPERDFTFVLLTTGLMEEANSWLRKQRLADLALGTLVKY